MRRLGLIPLITLLVLLYGCGGTVRQLDAAWDTDVDGAVRGELQILMPVRSSEADIRRVAVQALADARRRGPVGWLTIDFTDTSIYYGARFNLARVEFSPKRGPTDDAPLEPGGLAAHWVWREKALKPEKPRPADEEIRYFGVALKMMMGVPVEENDLSFWREFTAGKDPEELQRLYLRVQGWLFD